MKWFEPIIAFIAVLLVVLPIINKIRSLKKGETKCNGSCSMCSNKDDCLKNFKKYVKRHTR